MRNLLHCCEDEILLAGQFSKTFTPTHIAISAGARLHWLEIEIGLIKPLLQVATQSVTALVMTDTVAESFGNALAT